MFRQTLAVTGLNLANLRSRAAVSAVIVVGVGGVVAVLLGLLAMSAGFRATLTDSARADRAVILRSGASSEMNSWLSTDQRVALEQYPGLAVVSGETYTTLSIPRRETGEAAHVGARGVGAQAFALRPEVTVVAGRRFRPGSDEIIAGIGAAARYRGLAVGDVVTARGARLRVVGHFAAGGSPVESELWLDLAMAQDIFRRSGGVSVVRAGLAPGASPGALARTVQEDPRLPADLVPEPEYFAAQAATRAALIDTFAVFIAAIMAVGAVAAALNTMYAAVSRRAVEIATLRALGFGAAPVVVSVLIEAMLLALAGALLGAALVFAAFDGYAASTFNGAAGSQLAFAFRLTPGLVVTGVAVGLGLGLIGGLLPAWRAARVPIARALRAD